MTDELHDLSEEIETKVHALVDEMTAKLPPEDDEEIRQAMTETFRFWRD